MRIVRRSVNAGLRTFAGGGPAVALRSCGYSQATDLKVYPKT